MTSEQAERLIEAVNRAAAALEQLAERGQQQRPALSAVEPAPMLMPRRAAIKRDPA